MMKYKQMFLERGYIIDTVEPIQATNPVTTYIARKTATQEKVMCYEAVGSHRGILAARCLKIQAGRSQWKDAKAIEYWDEGDRAYLVVGLKGNALQRFLARLKFMLMEMFGSDS